MESRLTLLIISILLTITSCLEYKAVADLDVSKNVVDSAEFIDISGAMGVSPCDISEQIDEVRVIRLTTNTNSLLSRIRKVIVVGDYIYLLDIYKNGSVAVFDINGNFLKRLAMGNGPEEYSRADNISWSYSENLLYVLDEQSRKLIKYSADGQYKAHLFLDDWVTDIAGDGTMLVMAQSDRANSKRELRVIYQYSNGNKEVWSLGNPVVSDTDIANGISYFDGGYNIYKSWSNSIYYLKGDNLYRKYVFVDPKEDFKISGGVNDYHSLLSSLKNGKYQLGGIHFESRDFLAVNYFTDSDFGHIFYNKTTGDTWRRSGVIAPPSFFRLLDLRGVCMDAKNCFVGLLDCQFLNNKDFPEMVWDGSNPNNLISEVDMEKLRAVKPDDNPIIVLFKLKSAL